MWSGWYSELRLSFSTATVCRSIGTDQVAVLSANRREGVGGVSKQGRQARQRQHSASTAPDTEEIGGSIIQTDAWGKRQAPKAHWRMGRGGQSWWDYRTANGVAANRDASKSRISSVAPRYADCVSFLGRVSSMSGVFVPDRLLLALGILGAICLARRDVADSGSLQASGPLRSTDGGGGVGGKEGRQKGPAGLVTPGS